MNPYMYSPTQEMSNQNHPETIYLVNSHYCTRLNFLITRTTTATTLLLHSSCFHNILLWFLFLLPFLQLLAITWHRFDFESRKILFEVLLQRWKALGIRSIGS